MQLTESKESLEDAQRQHTTMVAALQARIATESSEDENFTSEKFEQLQQEFQVTSEDQLALIKQLTMQNEDIQSQLTSAEYQHKLNLSEI